MEYAFWIVIFCGLVVCGIKIGRRLPRRTSLLLQGTPMMVVCGWCREILSPGSEPASHGICPDCIKAHFPEVAETLAKEELEQ